MPGMINTGGGGVEQNNRMNVVGLSFSENTIYLDP